MNTNAHWTATSVDDFVYRISSDFALQIENKMDEEDITQSCLAEKLGVTPGRVSQILKDPGNLTLKKMVEYARSLGMKVSVVAYEDGDIHNRRGPINSQIFNRCWQKAGKPTDFFSLQQSTATVIGGIAPIAYIEGIGAGVVNVSGTRDTRLMHFVLLQDKYTENSMIIGALRNARSNSDCV
jgi:hypothetical protein